jgi:tripartite-type tricarboxylate transporter receptor subunit TctC
MRFARRPFVAAAALAAFLGVVDAGLAEGVAPSQPVRLIVPYVPGGLPDAVARIVAQRLTQELGQSVVVENKAGGGGALAAMTLAHAPADGHAFMVTDGPLLAITPFVTAKPAFQVQRDFVPVSLIGTAPLYLAVNAGVKANTLEELVAMARSKPGTLNYGSSGIGSIHHLTAEAMKTALGVDVIHVPFRGSGQSVPALIGGQVDMIFASPPTLMGFVKSGQAKLIAINTASRSPQTPDVPALAEKIPGFDFAFNVVMLARPGTPQDAIARMNAEIARIVRMPEVAQQLQKAGVDPVGASLQQTVDAIRAETQRIANAAQQAGLRPE